MKGQFKIVLTMLLSLMLGSLPGQQANAGGLNPAKVYVVSPVNDEVGDQNVTLSCNNTVPGVLNFAKDGQYLYYPVNAGLSRTPGLYSENFLGMDPGPHTFTCSLFEEGTGKLLEEKTVKYTAQLKDLIITSPKDHSSGGNKLDGTYKVGQAGWINFIRDGAMVTGFTPLSPGEYSFTQSNLSPGVHEIKIRLLVGKLVGSRIDAQEVHVDKILYLVGTPNFIRGDANGDGKVMANDGQYILDWLSKGNVPPPPCMDAADANDNGTVDQNDYYTISYSLGGTNYIAQPYPTAGVDPTADNLGCAVWVIPPPPPICGDNRKNGAELCDGTDFGGTTCMSLGYASGTLTCRPDCQWDTSKCVLPPTVCGDGVKNGIEVCDGPSLGGETCVTRGFSGGTLFCSADCRSFVTSGCYRCGDGIKNPAEQCDGTNLGGQTCQSLGYYGGTLSCSSTCTLNTAGCSGRCGDNILQSPEVCDGTNLSGRTCANVGYTSGTLSCLPNCQLDTSNCKF